jgi:superfamily II RNA helicase
VVVTASTPGTPLAELAVRAVSAEDALEGFLEWTAARGLALYPAQEEALLAVFAGDQVIVNTPTGSGKSLIALGAHVAAMAGGRRSAYTAPIKALVSEKFFALCADLGAANVGMLTGDAAINPTAPVVCATAEVVANMALRHGRTTPLDQVVMDEFHYYGDPDRGWAWQVPLLEVPDAQFVLMSATLGDTSRIEEGLRRRGRRAVSTVRSATRPVPLSFEYSRTPLHETIDRLAADGQAPLYVVHPSQASAVSHAQALTSAGVTTREERQAIAEAIAGFRFAPGFGRTLSRLLRHGIGVHHGGMLPKYRRLVERLTQAGLLKVVAGTDTLGVGVNLPLRTVVLTGLSKYDGTTSRLLSAREFHQIAGRAGRAGYDTTGLVVAQAPEHVIENERAVEKAAGDPKKLRKLVRSQPPRGFVPWDEAVFGKLVAAPPEPLVSHFQVSNTLVLDVLDRPGDGCGALKELLVGNDEPRTAQRRHIRQAIGVYRSLLAAGALERLDTPDEQGRVVRVTRGLQEDFALTSPLGPWVLEALPDLDRSSPSWALDVVSVIEATLDNPGAVLAAQLNRLKADAVTALKADGVEYEQRMEVLDTLEYPKPLRDWAYERFDAYRAANPWVADFNVRPKSVARDLYERAMTFAEFVAHYGLARSEGLVLRYLSDVYKGLVRTVPEDDKTDELLDVTEWLGELVRQVDSSLLDEWERLAAVAEAGADLDAAVASAAADETGEAPPPVTANERAFRVMVRNAAFRRVELLARGDLAGLAEADADPGWDEPRWRSAAEAYVTAHGPVREIGTGAAARAATLFQVRTGPGAWTVRQVLDDPQGDHDWAVTGTVELAASDAAGAPVWATSDVSDGLG